MIYLSALIICASFLYTVIFTILMVKLMEKERLACRTERAELLTRIQHPHHVMVPDRPVEFELQEETPDDTRFAGQVLGFPGEVTEENSDSRIEEFKQRVGWNDSDE
jgi:hypothetical protein